MGTLVGVPIFRPLFCTGKNVQDSSPVQEATWLGQWLGGVKFANELEQGAAHTAAALSL
ncbi:hypothetical protein [Brevibacillus sp. GCM10020057]|uniref:hypothetical protein n=1 Tax=Brevibacillus sp. GCM10020057 TaxID=3317327 RepID=UPI00366DC313